MATCLIFSTSLAIKRDASAVQERQKRKKIKATLAKLDELTLKYFICFSIK